MARRLSCWLLLACLLSATLAPPANGRAGLLIPKETRIRDRDHLGVSLREQ